MTTSANAARRGAGPPPRPAALGSSAGRRGLSRTTGTPWFDQGPIRFAAIALAALFPVETTEAQTIPTVIAEDATLGSAGVASGMARPTIDFDVRDGDFARGSDDDAVGLDRLPGHVQFGPPPNHAKLERVVIASKKGVP